MQDKPDVSQIRVLTTTTFNFFGVDDSRELRSRLVLGMVIDSRLCTHYITDQYVQSSNWVFAPIFGKLCSTVASPG